MRVKFVMEPEKRLSGTLMKSASLAEIEYTVPSQKLPRKESTNPYLERRRSGFSRWLPDVFATRINLDFVCLAFVYAGFTARSASSPADLLRNPDSSFICQDHKLLR